MLLTFLGTGAADHLPDQSGERRFTSTLVNRSLLLDVVGAPASLSGVDIAITHSHRDHYTPGDAARFAPRRLYAHESWAQEVDIDGITAIPMCVGRWYEAGDVRIFPIPANHATERRYEVALNYAIDDGNRRILYLTDTSWPLVKATNLLHGMAFDALVAEATVGSAFPHDLRILGGHMTLEMALHLSDVLRHNGMLREGAPVFLTHLARTLHPPQDILQRSLPQNVFAAYDGMTAEI